jgi:hypothetical protein
MRLDLLHPFRDVELDRRISQTADETVSHFLNRTRFFELASLINEIILLSNAQFVSGFMEEVGEELSRPSKQINALRIQTKFRDVGLNLFKDNPWISKFRAQLSPEGPNGWEALRFRFPESGLIDLESLKKIHHMNKFLINLRKCERDLTDAFRLMKRETGISKEAHVLRDLMIGYVSRTLSYFYVDVMRAAWSRFQGLKSESIESLGNAYDIFISELFVTIQSLQTPNYEKALSMTLHFVQLVASGMLSKPLIMQDLAIFVQIVDS